MNFFGKYKVTNTAVVHYLSSLILLVLNFATSSPLKIISYVFQESVFSAVFRDRDGEHYMCEAYCMSLMHHGDR